MATKLTKRDIDPKKTYVAWTSGVTELAPGKEVSFKRGQERRGSETIVKERPNLFVEFGTPQDEWPSELAGLNEIDAATDRAYRAELARHEPPPIPEEKRVVAMSTFIADGRTFNTGQTYSLDDNVVKKNKTFFAWPPKPLV
jgi:hypothetical protein